MFCSGPGHIPATDAVTISQSHNVDVEKNGASADRVRVPRNATPEIEPRWAWCWGAGSGSTSGALILGHLRKRQAGRKQRRPADACAGVGFLCSSAEAGESRWRKKHGRSGFLRSDFRTISYFEATTVWRWGKPASPKENRWLC